MSRIYFEHFGRTMKARSIFFDFLRGPLPDTPILLHQSQPVPHFYFLFGLENLTRQLAIVQQWLAILAPPPLTEVQGAVVSGGF